MRGKNIMNFEPPKCGLVEVIGFTGLSKHWNDLWGCAMRYSRYCSLSLESIGSMRKIISYIGPFFHIDILGAFLFLGSGLALVLKAPF